MRNITANLQSRVGHCSDRHGQVSGRIPLVLSISRSPITTRGVLTNRMRLTTLRPCPGFPKIRQPGNHCEWWSRGRLAGIGAGAGRYRPCWCPGGVMLSLMLSQAAMAVFCAGRLSSRKIWTWCAGSRCARRRRPACARLLGGPKARRRHFVEASARKSCVGAGPACGHAGSCAEYLYDTVSHLETLGIRDRNLWRLQLLVAEEIVGIHRAMLVQPAC